MYSILCILLEQKQIIFPPLIQPRKKFFHYFSQDRLHLYTGTSILYNTSVSNFILISSIKN